MKHTFRLFRIYLHLIRADIRSRVLQQRMVLPLFIVSLSTGYIALYLSLYFMLEKLQFIGQWNRGEVTFIYALTVLSSGITNLFLAQFRMVGVLVERGEFDRYLMRPLHPILQLMGSRFEINSLANLLVGVGILIAMRHEIPIVWDVAHMLLFASLLLVATSVHAAITVLIGACSFRLVRTDGLQDMYSTLRDFSLYPIDVYHPAVQMVLTFVVPLAFASIFPANYLFQSPHPDVLVSSWWQMVAFSALLLAASGGVWNRMINTYQSTGS